MSWFLFFSPFRSLTKKSHKTREKVWKKFIISTKKNTLKNLLCWCKETLGIAWENELMDEQELCGDMLGKKNVRLNVQSWETTISAQYFTFSWTTPNPLFFSLNFAYIYVASYKLVNWERMSCKPKTRPFLYVSFATPFHLYWSLKAKCKLCTYKIREH